MLPVYKLPTNPVANIANSMLLLSEQTFQFSLRARYGKQITNREERMICYIIYFTSMPRHYIQSIHQSINESTNQIITALFRHPKRSGVKTICRLPRTADVYYQAFSHTSGYLKRVLWTVSCYS